MNADVSDADQSFIAEALPAFISEAREQVEAIEQLLLQLEENPNDRELLDALFRCAHTVKGSAGIFGLNEVVGFTHHVETLLDDMREGKVELGVELSTLLLECNDQILHLVDFASSKGTEHSAHVELRADLITRLQAARAIASESAVRKSDVAAQSAPAAPSNACWLVSVAFGRDCFRNGMDPLSIIRYLGTIGTVQAISCDRSMVPRLENIDSESCFLNIDLELQTSAVRKTIEDAFSFVRDDCQLRLVEPGSSPEYFTQLINALPDRPLLGDILIKIGAISQQELKECLMAQAAAREQTGGNGPQLGSLLLDNTRVTPEVLTAALKKQGRYEPSQGSDEHRYIRVQADRLDEVINLLGELVVASAGASTLARQTRQATLIETHQHMGRLVEEIRNGTLQLRMVPIGETFSRFRRVVRDTASSLGKEVALEILGGDAEMDKSVVEKIADPLMHLVRNGLDHGLEEPHERLAAGKPAQGTLTLSARHQSGSILIQIRDDGRGIHREKVLQRAWERGLVEKNVIPSDADILKLIFAPGFSTAKTITNLSGRGVGMDVVAKNIAALRGTVTVNSEFGVGTTIDIRLPLTLAIIDGFLVSVAASKFIFPLDSVVEVIESKSDTTLDKHGRSVIELRGEMLPVVSLRALYGIESGAPKRVSVVVVGAGTDQFGVMVDALHGQHQTVIKPLSPIFKTLRGISGSSILGTGEVALIFDVQSLGHTVSESSNENLYRNANSVFTPGLHIIPTPKGQAS